MVLLFDMDLESDLIICANSNLTGVLARTTEGIPDTVYVIVVPVTYHQLMAVQKRRMETFRKNLQNTKLHSIS